MNINENVKELREYINNIPELLSEDIDVLKGILSEAADTIESLSAKLAAANIELERWHTEKVNDKIKNPFAWTSTSICHNCDHKDEYIEELESANVERSEAYCNDGWIPCKDRLPEEKINPITGDFYEYQVTFQSEDAENVCHYEFGNGHWWNGAGIMDEYVTAWRVPIKPFSGRE